MKQIKDFEKLDFAENDEKLDKVGNKKINKIKPISSLHEIIKPNINTISIKNIQIDDGDFNEFMEDKDGSKPKDTFSRSNSIFIFR